MIRPKHLQPGDRVAVLGGSMGGMQVLQWAVDYPDMMQAVIPIATACQFSPQNIAFDWVAREAIKADPNWKGGEYTADDVPARGLAAARMLAHITYLSDESMAQKFGRNLQDAESYSFAFKRDFAVESYLEYIFEQVSEIISLYPVDGFWFDIISQHGCVCDDCQIKWIKSASRNYIVVWNRVFNDNVRLD